MGRELEGNKRTPWIIGAVSGAVVVCGVILAVIFNHSQPAPTHQKTDTPTQNLILSGAINGRIADARKGDLYQCSLAATGPIVGAVGGQDYSFSYQAPSAKGPGTYRASAQIAHSADTSQRYAGDTLLLTINADATSGTIEGEMHATSGTDVVHVTGKWQCL